MPHFIRLRGPWEWQSVGQWTQDLLGNWQITPNDSPKGGITTLPGDWSGELGGGYRGSVLFTRAFRCPQSITDAAQVLLGIEDVDWQAKVELNEQLLGEIVCSRAPAGEFEQRCPVRFDIKRLLRPNNLLSVTVTSQPSSADDGRSGHLGLVRLEIE